MWLDADGDGTIDDSEGRKPGEQVLIVDAATDLPVVAVAPSTNPATTNGSGGSYSITFTPPASGQVKVVWDVDASGTITAGDFDSDVFSVLANQTRQVDIDVFDAVQFYLR